MSTETMTAVERAGDAFTEAYQRAVREAPSNRQGITREDGRKCYQAGIRAGMAAALTDPADADSLARTLYVLHFTTAPNRYSNREVRAWWSGLSEGTRAHWRAVADGLRATILGTTS